MNNSAHRRSFLQPSKAARTWALSAAATLLLASVAVPAHADSTTGTALTTSGKPIPGKAIAVTVVVTGKHLVDGPRYTVPGGSIQLVLNGAIVAQIRASYANSNVYESGCVDANCGLYVYRSRNTTVTFPVTLPKGPTSYQLVATYTGDQDSNSSTSAPVSLKPVHPNVNAALSLLLKKRGT